jgi:uncharacterized RDD family membrane protein YckC
MRFEAPGVRFLRPPEGVPLPFEVASPTDRVAAFTVDTLLVHVAAGVFLLVAAASLGGVHVRGYALSLAILASFFIRNFYFSFFEIRWGGRTPGKRAFGLRVVSRDGGALTAEAVFTRNLTRDLEVFLPVTALVIPEALIPGLPGWAALAASTWLFVFALLPLLNRDCLRLGDIVAGTLVVRMPNAKLLKDVVEVDAEPASHKGEESGARGSFEFSAEQLDHYGIRELQVLESLLRNAPGFRSAGMLEEVARRVRRKIGLPESAPGVDPRDFLTAFYKAQRARLEHKMLFGIRQEEKKQ